MSERPITPSRCGVCDRPGLLRSGDRGRGLDSHQGVNRVSRVNLRPLTGSPSSPYTN